MENIHRRYLMLPATIISINEAFNQIKNWGAKDGGGTFTPAPVKPSKRLLNAAYTTRSINI
jgi:hypothetical protein